MNVKNPKNYHAYEKDNSTFTYENSRNLKIIIHVPVIT